MRVKDRDSGLIMESNNPLVVEQWKKYPEKYIQPKKVQNKQKPHKK